MRLSQLFIKRQSTNLLAVRLAEHSVILCNVRIELHSRFYEFDGFVGILKRKPDAGSRASVIGICFVGLRSTRGHASSGRSA